MNLRMRRIAAVVMCGAVLGSTFAAFTAQANSTRFRGYCNHPSPNASEVARERHGC